MALYGLYKIDRDIVVGVWKINETTASLLELAKSKNIDTSPCDEFNVELRTAQWVSARLLLQSMMPEKQLRIIYDEFGKPHLEDSSAHISISHSRHFVAVIVNGIQPTGIDVELISPKIDRIARRFSSDEELKNLDEHERNLNLVLNWSAKEAIYKAYGRKRLIFKENIRILPTVPSEKGEMLGELWMNDKQVQVFRMKYEKMEDFVMVFLLNG